MYRRPVRRKQTSGDFAVAKCGEKPKLISIDANVSPGVAFKALA
jgi:hypothetical protein